MISRPVYRRPWILVTALLLLVCGTAVGVGTSVSLRRRTAAREQQDQALRAIREARSAGAARWAPETLGRAEQAVRDALLTMQAQEARLPLLARFAPAAAAWSIAGDAARDASRQAVAAERDARDQSAQAGDRARRSVSRIVATSGFVRLGPDGQTLLSRATLALAESQNLHRVGEYSGARDRALWVADVADGLNDEAMSIAARFFQQDSIEEWERWKRQLIEESHRQPAILIEKAEHRLTLYDGGKIQQSWDVELGPNWISAKRFSGDAATPEGQYRIVARKDRGQSAYYRALLLDYPNDRDRRAFLKAQRGGLLPPGAQVGGLIEIHGEGGRSADWTRGCVALPNAEIDQLFKRVRVGTPVTIVGGRGENLYQGRGNRSADSAVHTYER